MMIARWHNRRQIVNTVRWKIYDRSIWSRISRYRIALTRSILKPIWPYDIKQKTVSFAQKSAYMRTRITFKRELHSKDYFAHTLQNMSLKMIYKNEKIVYKSREARRRMNSRINRIHRVNTYFVDSTIGINMKRSYQIA